MNSLGRKIKEGREAKGMSLGDLSRACGLSKTHIWEMERGRAPNPTIVSLIRITEVLDVSLNTLAYAALDDYRDGISRPVTSQQLIARADEIARSDNPPVHPVRPNRPTDVHGEGG